MKEDWQAQVDWMRANGVVRAKWVDTGGGATRMALSECELAPRETEPAPAPQLSEEEQLKAEQRRLDLLDFGAA